MCVIVISSVLKHVSKEKSVGVAGRRFQHLRMQLQKMLRELESQSSRTRRITVRVSQSLQTTNKFTEILDFHVHNRMPKKRHHRQGQHRDNGSVPCPTKMQSYDFETRSKTKYDN